MTHYDSGLPGGGLVGAWTPGIGDASLDAWLVVGLYASAGWAIWRVICAWDVLSPAPAARERWFWKLLLVGVVSLGINKQLDLQSALTEVGRMAASRWGWYEVRHQVQVVFIAALIALALGIAGLLVHLVRGAPAATGWAAAGTGGLLLFVVLRAATFHHVGTRLGQPLAGMAAGWGLEAGNLLVILAGARRRGGGH